MRRFSWKVSDCEELMWADIQLPVQSVIRIFLTKKQSRLESQFPGDCMDNAYKFADKFADKWVVALANPAIARDYEKRTSDF